MAPPTSIQEPQPNGSTRTRRLLLKSTLEGRLPIDGSTIILWNVPFVSILAHWARASRLLVATYFAPTAFRPTSSTRWPTCRSIVKIPSPVQSHPVGDPCKSLDAPKSCFPTRTWTRSVVGTRTSRKLRAGRYLHASRNDAIPKETCDGPVPNLPIITSIVICVALLGASCVSARSRTEIMTRNAIPSWSFNFVNGTSWPLMKSRSSAKRNILGLIAIYANSKAHDSASLKWVQEHGQVCPTCSTDIERSEGCFHMTCSCGTHISATTVESNSVPRFTERIIVGNECNFRMWIRFTYLWGIYVPPLLFGPV
jgi:hypothetical protein